jgi:ribosomal protein L37AE/L43A
MEHEWEKKNWVTLKDREGLYDLWVCKKCGKKYKRRGLAWNPPHSQCKGGLTPIAADAEHERATGEQESPRR